MKFFIKLFVLILLISCKEERQAKFITTVQAQPIKSEVKGYKATPSVDVQEARLECDSVYINKKWFTACWETSVKAFVINEKNDTMFSEKQGIWRIEFKDFNEDGYKDMLVGYDGNNVVYDLGLFDSISDTFKLVEGFDNFGDAFILKGTNYYYSYSSAGCADLNWNSKLIYIKNIKHILLEVLKV